MRIFALLPIAFLLVALAPLEFILVESFYRFGHQRDLFQAFLFGLIWLVMLWVGVNSFLRWLRRARGAEAVGRAEKVIADFRAVGPVRLRGDDMLLTLDPARNVAVFENFKFTTSFFPQAATARLEVGFDEFVDTRYRPVLVVFSSSPVCRSSPPHGIVPFDDLGLRLSQCRPGLVWRRLNLLPPSSPFPR
jgi:hypothetical protein